jgi:hypothetical protein
MSRSIVKINDYYLEWSSIIDAPVTFGVPLDEFKEYYKEEYGNSGLRELERRIEDDELSGKHCYIRTLKDVVSFNRAGPDESELSPDEIYAAFCLRKPIRDNWLPREL